MSKRKYIGRHCSVCGMKVWTSIEREPFVCFACRKKAGETTNIEHASSLAILPNPIAGFGVCCSCHRSNQALSNGVCEDCRFYNIPEIDSDLSRRGQRSSGGEFDWVKHNR